MMGLSPCIECRTVPVFRMTDGTGDIGPVASGSSAVCQRRITVNTICRGAKFLVASSTQSRGMTGDTGSAMNLLDNIVVRCGVTIDTVRGAKGKMVVIMAAVG